MSTFIYALVFPEKFFFIFSPFLPFPPLIAGATVRWQTAAAVPRTKVFLKDLFFFLFNLNMRDKKECCSLGSEECTLGR